MKKHEYTAKLDTGVFLGADTKRAIYRTVKHYFESFPDSYYAEIWVDDIPCAFVWRTPDGLNVVPIVE